MGKNLDYDGRPHLQRQRELTEPPVLPSDHILSPGPSPDTSDPIEEGTKDLFIDLGKVYLKGNALAKGLKAMPGAVFIPIGEDARQVRVAARRLNSEETKDGTIIPYSVYTDAVDILADAQWKVRRIYESPEGIPNDYESATKAFTRQYQHGGNDLDNLIKSFFDGAGDIGSLLMALCIAPYQSVSTQALSSVETASKVSFTIQTILGIALLIELGYTAAEIVKSIRSTIKGPSDEEILKEVDNLSNNAALRKKVLDAADFEYEKFIESTKVQDSETVIEYCKSYIETSSPDSSLSYDHWIAYINVIGRQNIVRGALDNATQYSQDFSNKFEPEGSSSRDSIRISNTTASHYSDIVVTSNAMYNGILNSFMHQITDSTMCCMVTLFGAMDTSVLRSMSVLVRMLAIDFQSSLARVMQLGLDVLTNFVLASADMALSRIDRAIDQVLARLLDGMVSMQEEIPVEFERCLVIPDIAVIFGVTLSKIKEYTNSLLQNVTFWLESQTSFNVSVWSIPAERRHLTGIASILTALADSADAARVCENSRDSEEILLESKDAAANQIIHTLLEKSPPSVQISDDDIRKYFPDLQPSESPMFGFQYGPASVFPESLGRRQQDGQIRRDESQNSCEDPELAKEAAKKVAKIMSTAFNNTDA